MNTNKPGLCPPAVFGLLAAGSKSKTMQPIMKTLTQTWAGPICALVLCGTTRADDGVAGEWTAQFDSQIGIQKYTYDFKVSGTNLTGTARGEREQGTNEVIITHGIITTNGISFVEPLKFGENEIRIEYTGKVSGDEIKFHRRVGDFAEEDLVAHRVKRAAAAAESSGTNAPPGP